MQVLRIVDPTCLSSCNAEQGHVGAQWAVASRRVVRKTLPVAVSCMRSSAVVEKAPVQTRTSQVVSGLVGLAASASVLLTCGGAMAVSGGGGLGNDFDFKDLAGSNYEGAQFYKVNFRQTNFTNANLKRANMFGSFAKGANFTGADMTQADIESVDFQQANLSNAILTEAEVAGAQFRELVSIDGSDWTDVNLRKDQRKYLCKMAEGTNPVTGNVTKETLLCP